ncbi:MAG: aminopeptidase [Pseudomonadota bacterium]|nr:MAG: aminopeptidase [Pseudomonadota bacterium]
MFLVYVMAGLAGCATVAWYGQAARGQLEVLAKREDIADLIADPATPDRLRQRLERVLAIRDFASRKLGLPDSGSYRHYADLGRSAPVWNVVATPRYSVEPKTWCYPLVGCLAYRGYFRRDAASRHALRLREEGLDVAVFPAVAYSTLGWFDDPVLDSMLGLEDEQLAELVFHELAHEALYLPGETAFNEAFATFVGREGVRRWLELRGDAAALARWQRRRIVDRALTDQLLMAREALARAYAEPVDETQLETARERIFGRLRAQLRQLADQHDSSRLNGWLEQPLNNAHLSLVATYESGVAAFAGLLAECNGDVDCFRDRVNALERSDSAVRAAFLAPDH